MNVVTPWAWSMLLLILLIGLTWGMFTFMVVSSRVGRQLADHVRIYGYTTVVHENLIEMRFWERLATLLAFGAGACVILLIFTLSETVRRVFLNG